MPWTVCLLSALFCLFSILAVDLLEKMLNLDTDVRLNAEQALAHPYLATYADPEDEVQCIPVFNRKILVAVFCTLCIALAGLV